MKVLIFGRGDYAGSGVQACKAINHYGKIECRHLCLTPNPFLFERDITIPVLQGPAKSLEAWRNFLNRQPINYPRQVQEVRQLVKEADLVHIWNNEEQDVPRWMNVPSKKIKSFTWTGTDYRLNHTAINKATGKKAIVVQNPNYRFDKEHPTTFIPHAVNTDKLKPLPIDERDLNKIGCYTAGNSKKTTAAADVVYLEELLRKHFPNKKIILKERWAWQRRMTFLSKAGYLFEYMDADIGYWGRSALEAAALGLPVFSYNINKVVKMAEGRIGKPPIIHITKSILLDRLRSVFKGDYEALSKAHRDWVVKYYSYDAVGKLYTDFFRKL